MTENNRPLPPGLVPFANETVAQFAQIPGVDLQDQDKERHRIFSLLLMAILDSQWNGNKFGEVGDYGPWRANQLTGKTSDGNNIYGGGTYLGHNIAALAVDGEGRIIDYDFNHNQVFDSTVEHAESRLVRRVFALNQVYDPWFALEGDSGGVGGLLALRPRQRRRVFATAVTDRAAPSRSGQDVTATDATGSPTPYSTLLKDVTIYTSLESCAQCSGIMTLASVEGIVYLQWDQGQFLIGNIMWQCTTAENMGFNAPRPIRGDDIDLPYFMQLNDANDAFNTKVATVPFYTSPTGVKNTSPAVTSFLCTDIAQAIFAAAAAAFASMTLTYPAYQPIPSALTNLQALQEAQDFLAWVVALGNRGTPHRI